MCVAICDKSCVRQHAVCLCQCVSIFVLRQCVPRFFLCQYVPILVCADVCRVSDLLHWPVAGAETFACTNMCQLVCPCVARCGKVCMCVKVCVCVSRRLV